MLRIFLVLLILLTNCLQAQQPVTFDIVTAKRKATIYYDTECKLDSIVANLLANDIELLTGYRPRTTTGTPADKGNSIIIGSVHSKLIRGLGIDSSLAFLKGKWERFARYSIKKFGGTALVICGSDFRGTAYGVFDLSRELGVSPWYWWADVKPSKRERLSIDLYNRVSPEPSVKYRGIFINDEDWGLQPWAAKTFEPETGDIGPKTYAKIFELLLRLKANLIWPAMHPSTKAFFHYPQNIAVAKDYEIVIGSSHAEPMLRNNVGEWNEKSMGHFNYRTNKDTIYKYWEDRVKESAAINGMYTIGMRGVHDSGMEGVKDPKEAVPLIEQIFADQRGLLAKHVNSDVAKVPQVFTAYKEVLDIYDNGLKIPEDVTLVWPDDNYGYIHRLNNDTEKKRGGGSGVYYHASYWGRPHDYLWLSSTHPALMHEEMMKAYDHKANTLWVVNVGDIKPQEYDMQLFLDMAYDITPFRQPWYVSRHLMLWMHEATGPYFNSDLLWNNYQLAFERRPEFMGWSQTEPTTNTRLTAYNHFSYGDEAQRRIEAYSYQERVVKLRQKSTVRYRSVRPERQDAYFQLVYYPVVCASYMNKKFLYRDKAYVYGRQNRISAYYYAAQANAMYDSIRVETERYNHGKWKGMMSMQPRNLPVYQPPAPVVPPMTKGDGWDAVPEGYDTIAYDAKKEKELPVFVAGLKQSFFIDVFLTDSLPVAWKAVPSARWIKISAVAGNLLPLDTQTTQRVWVRVDSAVGNGYIDIIANGKNIRIAVRAARVVHDAVISVFSAGYTSNSNWKLLPGLGHSGSVLQSADSGKVTYSFHSFSNAALTLMVYTLPTHPLHSGVGMRYGVSVDNGPVQEVNFRTVGRSEEWKQNVLRNASIQKIALQPLAPGKHQISFHAIDPGVLLDRFVLQFGNMPSGYSVIPETWPKNISK